MKLKYYIFPIFVWITFLNATGQDMGMMAPKQIRGINAASAGYLFSEYEKGGFAGYSRYFQKKYYISVGGCAKTGKIGHMEYWHYLGFVDFNKTVLNVKNKVFLNIGIVSGAGNEKTSMEFSESSREGFIYEAGVTAGAEVYIFPMASLNVSIRQIVFTNSSMGNRHYNLPISLRIYY